MKLTIESTSLVTDISAGERRLQARVWEGQTESGVKVALLVLRVAVPESAPAEEHERFARELAEQRAPTEIARAFPLRMVL